MLVTFIISQRKSIPAISKSVEMLAAKYGHCIDTGYESLRTFPTPQEMACASEDELMECSLGYRTKYVLDALHPIILVTGNKKLIRSLPAYVNYMLPRYEAKCTILKLPDSKTLTAD